MRAFRIRAALAFTLLPVHTVAPGDRIAKARIALVMVGSSNDLPVRLLYARWA